VQRVFLYRILLLVTANTKNKFQFVPVLFCDLKSVISRKDKDGLKDPKPKIIARNLSRHHKFYASWVFHPPMICERCWGTVLIN